METMVCVCPLSMYYYIMFCRCSHLLNEMTHQLEMDLHSSRDYALSFGYINLIYTIVEIYALLDIGNIIAYLQSTQ